MKQVTTFVGIDAHKKDLFVALLAGERTSHALRSSLPTRAPRLHVLSTKHPHACSARGNLGNHRISA